jgi:type II secretory pathway component GspD/PulD (secretin)
MLTLWAKVHVAAFPARSILTFHEIPPSTRSLALSRQPSLILFSLGLMIPHAMKHHVTLCSFFLAGSLAWATPTPSGSTASVTLNFPQNDIGDILSLYTSLTHYKIIRDSVRYGPLALSIPEPVTPQKAIDIIEKTLFTNGFSIIQVDADTVEIDGPGKNPRGNGVPTISAASQLPAQERLVSYLFTFKHAKCAKMLELFQQYLMPLKMYTSFICAEDANALWVTERTSVIRQLLIAAEKLDVPPTSHSDTKP